MASYYDNIDRWIGRILHGGTDRDVKGNIFGDGDRIFSYGRHFEMARLLRDRKGAPVAFLVNGEVFSVTTSRHQFQLRQAIARTGVPAVTIPYGAMTAAGIERDSVQLVDVSKDRLETKEHVAFEPPASARWVTVDEHSFADFSAEELAEIVAKRNRDERERWERSCDHYRENPELWSKPPDEPPTVTVEDLENWQRRTWRKTGERRVLRLGRFSEEIEVRLCDDGRTEYRWTTRRHWLGASLIRAKVTWFDRKNHRERSRHAFFLSGFDHNEYPRNVYFFCELPRGARPTTVAEAYEALKPETVRLAEQMGRSVHRQGDIFAVELRDVTKRELRRQGARFEKRGALFATNHVATETAYMPDGTTLVRGTLHHAPRWRRPDHRRVTVGKAWHVAIKNTVPVTK